MISSVSKPTSVLRIRATVVKVERNGLHGLSGTKSAGRFSRHATLNSLKKQTLGSLDLSSMPEPRGLYRTDGKRPDCVTMIRVAVNRSNFSGRKDRGRTF